MPKKKTGKPVGRPKGIKQPKKGKGKKSLPKKRPPVVTSFQPGNQLWMKRFLEPSRHYSPEELRLEFVDYIKRNQTEGVWYKMEAVKSGPDTGRLVQTPCIPPLSELGFCVHLGITQKTFIDYKKDSRYSDVTANISEACRKNKLDGANMGFFNANIVARELGLADATKVEVLEGRKNVNEIFGAIGLGGNDENKIEE